MILKIMLPTLLYFLIGMIIATVCYVFDVSNDEEELALVIIMWPFMILLVIILSPGYIASYLGEFIKRRIKERENDK